MAPRAWRRSALSEDFQPFPVFVVFVRSSVGCGAAGAVSRWRGGAKGAGAGAAGGVLFDESILRSELATVLFAPTVMPSRKRWRRSFAGWCSDEHGRR
eukprot:scaffold58128_cov28-Phaeocystis_antarctica.AAC.2